MPNFEAQKTYALFDSPANRKLIAEINKSGANQIQFPIVFTEAAELSEETKNLLKNLSGFDWIIFPDIFSVDYFLQALEKFEIDFFELDALRVCAFSETVSDRLRFSQIHADVISNLVETEFVLQTLKDYEPDFRGLKFLIPTKNGFDLKITERLIQLGASVNKLPVYITKINNDNQLVKLKTLLKGGAVDEFIFSSPEDVEFFAVLFQSNEFRGLLAEAIASATNAQTFSALCAFGLDRIVLHQ